jgi:hypothetical protein
VPSLNIKIDKQADHWRVTLEGTIDEDFNFSNHNIVGAPRVDFYLAGVKSINSCGIREWIKWMQTINSNIGVYFYGCPKVIVDQINMVDGFLPNHGIVQSFYVPFFSEDTGDEKLILFKRGTEFTETGFKIPEDIKDTSGKEMEMDVIEAKYFKFLKRSA